MLAWDRENLPEPVVPASSVESPDAQMRADHRLYPLSGFPEFLGDMYAIDQMAGECGKIPWIEGVKRLKRIFENDCRENQKATQRRFSPRSGDPLRRLGYQ